MGNYFVNFPKTSYTFANASFTATKVISNISLKTALVNALPQDDPYLYYNYLVKENERAEDIANFYYNDPGLVWLVYFANNIIDPYTQWILSYEDFTAYFRKKYAASALPIGTDPIIWGQNTSRTDNIMHWIQTESQLDDNGFTKDVTIATITPTSYTRAQTFDATFDTSEWTAVRYYDYEMEENENRRSILLVNDRYATIAEENLQRLLNA